MDILKNWTAKRAGSGVSVTHSCGKVTGLTEITVEAGKVIAAAPDGRRYELAVQS